MNFWKICKNAAYLKRNQLKILIVLEICPNSLIDNAFLHICKNVFARFRKRREFSHNLRIFAQLLSKYYIWTNIKYYQLRTIHFEIYILSSKFSMQMIFRKFQLCWSSVDVENTCISNIHMVIDECQLIAQLFLRSKRVMMLQISMLEISCYIIFANTCKNVFARFSQTSRIFAKFANFWKNVAYLPRKQGKMLIFFLKKS